MPNEDIGEIPCPAHLMRGERVLSAIRKNAKGKLYLVCPKCGIDQATMPARQEIILELGTFYGPEGKPAPAPTRPAVHVVKPPPAVATRPPPAPVPAPAPVDRPAPEPAPKPKPAGDDLDGWF